MGLPTSRDVTFAPGSQVPSSVLNNLQDGVVDLHGRVTTLEAALTTKTDVMAIGGQGYGTGTFNVSGSLALAPTQSRTFPITVLEGKVITGASMRVFGSGTDGIRLWLRAFVDDVEVVSGGLPAQATSALSATWQTVAISTSQTVAVGQRYVLEVQHQGAGGASATVDYLTVTQQVV